VIADRVAAVRERIARAAACAGREPEEIALLAVSKTHPAAAVKEAFESGLRLFGENRIQEAAPKIAELQELRQLGLEWHLVGHLQSNKARKAVSLFDFVHSMDSLDLAARLASLGREGGRAVRALIQVDLAGEETKSGLPARDLLRALEALREEEGLHVEGLMLLPPYESDPERTRPFFRELVRLRDEAFAAGLLRGRELSMGMSHDLEVAIEEQATMVRVGTAIFGERP
jgi:pyridoxal phosphate enzyme (YggS family)